MLGVGVLPANAYYKGLVGTVGYTYHFNDTFAWQVGRGTYSYNLQTSLRRQLERDFNTSPNAAAFQDQVQWMVGSDLIWSPLYGKMAFLNASVLHVEAFLLGGGTVVKLDRDGGFRPGVNVGLGVRLFTGKTLSLRLDVTNNAVFTGPSRVIQVPQIQFGTAFNFGATE
nr:outer membrane beta-barrel domain-containing protein [Comamonas sp. JC664]